MKKIFNIPVTWEVWGTVQIEAESLEEAIKIFDKEEKEGIGYSLPLNSEYVDGSFRREDEEFCYFNNEKEEHKIDF